MLRPALAAAILLAGPAAGAPPDLETLSACSGRAWEQDVKAWSGYVFDRHVLLRDLDRDGEVVSRVERRFLMTPDEGGFDERLLSENGRPAEPAQIREFRRKANFTRNYRGAAQLEFSNPLGENLVLLPVLRQQERRLLGETEIDGVRCYRTAFDAGPDPPRASARKRLAHALRGSSCVTVEGCHVVRLELETVRPIQQGLATIERMRVTILGQPVEDGWVPRRVEAEFDFSFLGRHRRRITTYSYSNFRRP